MHSLTNISQDHDMSGRSSSHGWEYSPDDVDRTEEVGLKNVTC